MLNGWPQGWTALYRRLKLIHNDPVVAHCLRSTAPFEWREAPYDPLANPKAKDVMDRARDFRMRDGFCVPIHTSDGYEAVVTMARDRVEFTGKVRPALHLMALYAYGKAVDLCMPQRFPAVPLSDQREREVLQWTAAGKTSWKISQILGVAEFDDHRAYQGRRRQARYAEPRRHGRRRAAPERNLPLIGQFPEMGITAIPSATDHRSGKPLFRSASRDPSPRHQRRQPSPL